MKVHDEWHVGVLFEGRKKETEEEVSSGVNDGVRSYDAVDGLFGRLSFEVE